MRIISQSGLLDVPYESIILQRLGTSIFNYNRAISQRSES